MSYQTYLQLTGQLERAHSPARSSSVSCFTDAGLLAQDIEENGEVIEDYPDDPRGHSCLILGRGEEGRSIHVVCSPKDEFLAIITAYVPSADEWENDGKTRISR
jgi:hypothetical protein